VPRIGAGGHLAHPDAEGGVLISSPCPEPTEEQRGIKMQNVILNGAALLTGNWLSQERQRLGKTRAEVVKAVRVHSATLRSVEHQNRVLPPGWYPALRELGMQVQEPVWPAQMVTYTGADLNRDLRTCAGLQPSRFWLSKQLCISESEVGEVVRGNLPVPHSWLLKLAELGANVPAPVRTALHPPVSQIQNLGPAARTALHPSVSQIQNLGPAVAPRPALDVALRLPGEPVTATDRAASSPLDGRRPGLFDFSNSRPLSLLDLQGGAPARAPALAVGETIRRGPFAPDFGPSAAIAPTSLERQAPIGRADPAPAKAEAGAPSAVSERRERASIFFHWTEEGGLYFSVTAPPSPADQCRTLLRVVDALRTAAETVCVTSSTSAA